ncbi:MAG: HAMP domain-containing histidine kinase [Anaerolineales bacterium]|nr:HAMP domain-containing histidine kinase [Anaerolineales bacterium]
MKNKPRYSPRFFRERLAHRPGIRLNAPNEKSPRRRRFFPFFFFFFGVISLFVGGVAAILYWAFSQFSGVRNIWLLLCGAPVAVLLLGVLTMFTLYRRFGRPLSEMFNAIDAVSEGDLSVRVSENKSDMFSELIKRFNKMVEELERADQQRRNLTADIAHELRTPLHIIQGNLEGLMDGVYQPTAEHLNNTLDETKLLTRLINDLQTLSLAEAHQLPLHPTRFLLADLLHDLASSFSSQAKALGIRLEMNVKDSTLEITADYDRLNQVLSNLISNALRHTPKDGKIALETESITSQERGVRIVVEDSGVGIASEDLPFIFDRFWRGDKSRTGRANSGLGLAIAKQLVEAHGGAIKVESGVGKGAKFVIELPGSN